MKGGRSERVLRFASVAAIVAVLLMAWSLVDPRPVPVVVAMSLGQGIGTLALAAFGVVVWADLKRGQRAIDRAPPSERRPPSA